MECSDCGRRPLVCLFDSGIGGLNLLDACVRRLPQVDFYYFADNFNVPYGNLGEGEIYTLVKGVFREIAACRPVAAVVACNTVTAGCISSLRKTYGFPILGIEPALKQAWKRGGDYLVLATRSTCSSPAFASLMQKYGSRATVCPCGDLAERIERGIFSLDGEALVSCLPQGGYNSVVLGCTHYIFIEKAIQKRYGCPVFDGMSGTAAHLATILGNSAHFSADSGKIAFFCGDFTKNRAVFEKMQQIQ